MLLHNLLVLDRDGVGGAMCAPPLAALPQLVATLEAAGELHPARLRFVGHVAFHLSLVAAARPHAAALLRACQAALSAAVEELASTSPRDPQASAELAAQLARALFNLLRLEPPTSGAAAARLAEDLGGEVTRLLGCTAMPSAAGTAAATADAADALLEAQLASLQLCVALPKELAFPPVSGAWRALVAILLPTSEQAEAALVAGEPSNTQPLLPLLTLQA